MTRSLRTLRRLGQVSVPLGIATLAVGVAAAPAMAATSLTVSNGSGSVAGQTLRAPATLTVTGTDSSSLSRRTLTLSMTSPTGQTTTLASRSASAGSSGSVSASADLTHVVNGDYVFALSDTGSSATPTATVTLAVPPASVAGFAGTVNGTVASFSWTANTEPDLVGYDLRDGSTDLTPGGIDDATVCQSGSCGVTIDFGPNARGTTQTVQIVALRHTAPGSSGTVASDPASTQVTFAAPPSPAPSSPASTSGGGRSGAGSSGGSGSATTGAGGANAAGSGSTVGTTRSGHSATRPVTGKHPATELRAFLPTSTAGAAPNLPALTTEVQPLPEGSYKPTLAYPDQTLTSAVHQPGTSSPAAVVTSDIVRILNVQELWKALAAAAVLLLVAAHLRAWMAGVEALD